MNPKDDIQNPVGTPLSGSLVADEPIQPIEPETPISGSMGGIPTSIPKAAPSVPSISQDEPLTGGMGSGIGTVTPKVTMPAVDEPTVVNEPEEAKEEPEINPLVTPDTTSTEDTGTGGLSSL